MRALVFDLDGTLLQYTAAYRDLLATTFETVSGRVEDAWLDSYEDAFFEEVEQRLGADRYAMIGDSDDDVDGAAAAGWASVRYEVGRLAELPAVLGWE